MFFFISVYCYQSFKSKESYHYHYHYQTLLFLSLEVFGGED